MSDLQKQHLEDKIEKAQEDLENKELFRTIIAKTLDMKIFGNSPRGLAYQLGIMHGTVIRYSKGLTIPLPPMVKTIYRVIKREL